MKIIRKRIVDMERATYNPRVELQPGDAEYETLKRSLEQFGMVEPVVWNERTNRVVGGHQRLTVEAALGHEEVDVSVVDLDEIKEKVNAETYFTAEEAVEFGLADEIDETTEVKNTASGGFVMLNGLKADSRFFANAPNGFIHAEQPKASAVQKEVHKMNLETLKAEHPELVQAIRNEAIAEGAAQERARIQAIEDIAVVGHENLVNAAKFDGKTTAEALAVQILKADKARGAQMLKDRKNDAKDLEGIEHVGNEGLDPKAEAKAKQDAEMKAAIEAGARAFARK